jgi:mevalonate kinase
MNTRLIISLVIAGLVIALAGGVIDYQRRVQHRADYEAWRANERSRQQILQMRLDSDTAEMNRSVAAFSQSSAESLAKLKAANDQVQAAAQEEFRLQQKLKLQQMSQQAEADLTEAAASFEKSIGIKP